MTHLSAIYGATIVAANRAASAGDTAAPAELDEQLRVQARMAGERAGKAGIPEELRQQADRLIEAWIEGIVSPDGTRPADAGAPIAELQRLGTAPYRPEDEDLRELALLLLEFGLLEKAAKRAGRDAELEVLKTALRDSLGGRLPVVDNKLGWDLAPDAYKAVAELAAHKQPREARHGDKRWKPIAAGVAGAVIVGAVALWAYESRQPAPQLAEKTPEEQNPSAAAPPASPPAPATATVSETPAPAAAPPASPPAPVTAAVSETPPPPAAPPPSPPAPVAAAIPKTPPPAAAPPPSPPAPVAAAIPMTPPPAAAPPPSPPAPVAAAIPKTPPPAAAPLASPPAPVAAAIPKTPPPAAAPPASPPAPAPAAVSNTPPPAAAPPANAPSAAAVEPQATPAPAGAAPASSPPVEVAALAPGAIDQALKGYGCAELSWASNGSNIFLRGHAASAHDKASLIAAVAKLPGVGQVTDELTVLGRPLCSVIENLEPVRENNWQRGLALDLRVDGEEALSGGKALAMEVSVPSFEASIYVDLFRPDGKVQHLVPNGLDALHRLPARSLYTVGKAPGTFKRWTVAPPFGDHVVVALATRDALFNELRPETEDAAKYLAELTERVKAIQTKDAGGIAAAVRLIVTKAPK